VELSRRGSRPRLVAVTRAFAALAILGAVASTAVDARATTAGVYVQSDDAVVRESPNAAARPLAHPMRGEELLSFGRRGDWVNVLIHQGGESKNGWIAHDAVSETPPPDAAAPLDVD